MTDAQDVSLAAHRQLLFACLDAVAPGSVVEVGSFRGEFTAELLRWASDREARITAIEPLPPAELLKLRDAHPGLELVEGSSLDVLRRLPPFDAVIIDGDHNHFTVSEELRLVEERAGERGFPLVALHDVGWPHARRDTYYAPERIPEDRRQPLAREALLAPGEPGVADAGLLFPCAAEREGGPRNGVLTAVEDFIAGREDLRLAVVPAFFGLGILWPADADWAGQVAAAVAPFDRSPMLERLEATRVQALVDRYRLERRTDMLRSISAARTFAVAERLSRMRHGGDVAISRERIRRLLGD